MADEAKKEKRREKDLKALIDGKMDVYGVTKRTIYSAIGIFGCLLLTVVMSITGMGFDPKAFSTWNYWTKMIVQFSIAIFAMITGRQIGDDTQRNRKTGQFRRELSTYSTQYNRMNDLGILDYFEAWLTVYKEKKLQKKIRETLRNFGIKQFEVLDLDLSDLENLQHPWVKDWTGTPFYEKYYDEKKKESKTTFKSLSEAQINAVRAVMEGQVRVSDVSASYFLTALKGTSVDEWERAAKSDKKKGAKLASGYSYRLFMMLGISLVLNGLIPSPYDSADSVVLNIATRIFVLITSTVWGIYLGFKVVEMDIVFLAYKSYIIRLCCDEVENGTFKPETIEQQAEREYAEYEAEQAKAAASVVTPILLTGGENDDA